MPTIPITGLNPHDPKPVAVQVIDNKIETWVLTSDQLEAMFKSAKPGDVLVYAVGDMYGERVLKVGSPQWSNWVRTGEAAYQLYKDGDASHLWQKKLAPYTYEYRIVKR